MFKRKITLLVLNVAVALGLAGCATNSDQLKVAKMQPKERLYVGRVLVDFGDTPSADLKCEVYINSDIVPIFKLSSDGYFFYKTDREKPRLSNITCYHRPSLYLAAWHHHALNLKHFYRPDDQKEAVYFGDIIVKWNFNKDATGPAAEKQPYTSNPPREGHVYDSGEMKLEVKSDFEMMNRLFYEKVDGAKDAGFVLKEHLVEIDK
jgi:hypothetical protein